MKKSTYIVRLIFSCIFMLCAFGCMAYEGYLYYQCREYKIEYMRGFKTAIPVIIVLFWFSCFFDDVSVVKTDEGRRYIIKKLPRRIIGIFFTLACVASIAFWLYMYHTKIARLF